MVVTTREDPYATVLAALLEDSEDLIADNLRPVPLELCGLKVVIDDEDWAALKETRSMSWLQKHLGHDEDSWWSAVAQGHLQWFKVLGLPRFPSWQFRTDPNRPVEGLAELNEGIPEWWDAADISLFMTSQHPDLASRTTTYLSPAEWLAHGFDAAVIETILQNYRMGPLVDKNSDAGGDQAAEASAVAQLPGCL
ncbi:hypothetical protein IFT79_05305 [Frigoribacterium sp. CFBP 8759]|uniref:hypothetical protein n=1 Tax=Frigoribacterium sp. CFBP 8759 TaxID=2775283 RepID=UPI00177D0D72|nr:hypothetical protein [Frigoribacterium sp. CFBP 8759]MBD8485028.1 hypothetical protein [Frigoribacterium sp. CFBP 8759]